MYHYIVHLTMKLFGLNVAGARVSSAVIGALGVVAVYFMVKNFSGKRVALFSAIFMVFYHFSIHYSRVALNNIWDTLWVPLIIYSFVKGWDEDWIGGAVIAGAALGFSQYFYHGSKIVVFLLLILMISHWKQGGILIRKARFLGAMALVTLCVAGPMIMFSFASPEIFYARLRDDWGWKQQAVQATLREVNYWKYFWYQLLHSLGTYTIYPDPSGFYRPNIPLTAGLSAILLMAGSVIAMIRRNWLPIFWLLLTSLFGGFMLCVPHSSPHYVVAIPAICWLIGLAINWIWESGYAKAAIIVLCAAAAIDLYFYFYVFTYSIPPDFNLPFPP